MKLKETVAYFAGQAFGRALIGAMELMYQNNNSLKFFMGLMDILTKEFEKHEKEIQKKEGGGDD